MFLSNKKKASNELSAWEKEENLLQDFDFGEKGVSVQRRDRERKAPSLMEKLAREPGERR